MAQPSSSPSQGVPRPFASAVFFPESSRVYRLDLLYSLVLFSTLTLVITGPRGAGKTTLLRRLKPRLEKSLPIALVTAHAQMDANALLDLAQEQFAIALEGKRGSGLAVLMVDEAQQLDNAALNMLLRAPAGGENGRMRVVLAGREELQRRIAPLVEDSTIPIQAIPLTPFSSEDTAEYIRQRLGSVGIRQHALLDPRGLQQIHQDAGGWPGLIEQLAQATLAGQRRAFPSRSSKRPKFRFSLRKREVVIGLTGLVVAIGIALLLQGEPPPLRPHLPAIVESVPSIVHPVDSVPLIGKIASPTPEDLVKVESNQPGKQSIPSASPPPPTVPVTVVGPTTIPATQATSPEVGPGVPPPAESVGVATSPSTVSKAAPELVQPPKQPPSSHQETTGPIKAALPPSPHPASMSESGQLHSQDWLLAQRPQDYTLQIMGTPQESALRNTSKGLNLPGVLAYFHTQRKGQDWYGLVYGVYPSMQQAQQAAQTLPAGIGKPWIRSIANIHQDIRLVK